MAAPIRLDVPPDVVPPVVVGCSGGADSLALLALAVEAGLEPIAVHVDHGLRGGSGREGDVGAGAAARRGARFDARRVHVESGPNLEARARAARYDALEMARAEHGATAVLVAHTADDQAETVLLNLLRGSGSAGLAGLPPRPRRPGPPPPPPPPGGRGARARPRPLGPGRGPSERGGRPPPHLDPPRGAASPRARRRARPDTRPHAASGCAPGGVRLPRRPGARVVAGGGRAPGARPRRPARPAGAPGRSVLAGPAASRTRRGRCRHHRRAPRAAGGRPGGRAARGARRRRVVRPENSVSWPSG